MIYDNLKSAQVKARLSKDQPLAAVLTTAISEIASVAKNENREVTDDDCCRTLAKFIKNSTLMSEMATKVQDVTRADAAKFEISTLSQFLPVQLTGDQLTTLVKLAIVSTSASSIRDMGTVMKWLNSNHPNQFNASEASMLVKHQLA